MILLKRHPAPWTTNVGKYGHVSIADAKGEQVAIVTGYSHDRQIADFIVQATSQHCHTQPAKPEASTETVPPDWHREWKFAVGEAIDVLDCEIDNRDDEENIRRMKRALNILRQIESCSSGAGQSNAKNYRQKGVCEFSMLNRKLSTKCPHWSRF
ncbi:hypothetical protein [Eoetvoesiella caeni]|uniref:hypothetical protein n=1 Tax=Eoetvoesiella caeni TaxID=645616 RepID=UPI0011BDB574|nr:hypothetical protein [Eoetvoesiella caeni]MCI2811307.1 hypothetical protein [Eoetvoesiella caeni]NYT57194.1 hypothetical protein [Eoetvoesiella caeni]